MTCDHAATRASLQAFLTAAKFHGIQLFPDGEVQLMANCKGCQSTLAVSVELVRPKEAHGTIGAQPSEPPVIGARRRELTEHCWWCRASVGAPCTTPDGTLIPGPTHLTTSPPPEPIGVVRAPRQNPGDGETAQEHANRVIK